MGQWLVVSVSSFTIVSIVPSPLACLWGYETESELYLYFCANILKNMKLMKLVKANFKLYLRLTFFKKQHI